ncbi:MULTISPECIES: eIF2A-related protein [unclassified Microcoleus]|uniref:eIF2A-related protein n=1 Tax=unclassified Microcoleus TaxID=2642155 RepID=UPI002FD431E7
MVNSNLAEDIAAENERSLSTLVRTISRFQGKFSLTIVRCNYASLRYAMLEKLRDRSTVQYQELVLEPATQTLYQTILNAVQEQPPKALIIVGIESVVALDDLLAGANRARDQFKQDFAFPLILWVTDFVLSKFSRSANDLKSWAPPPIQFTMPPYDLMIFLRQKAGQAFGDVENFKLDDCEIESLENDLLNVALGQELQASWQFIQGLVEYLKNKIDSALQYYHQSLTFWQQNHPLERQGIVCQKIAQAYNRKAELHRAGNQGYWQEARKYLQQSQESFEQAQRHDLAAKCISQLGEVLRLLQAWEELQSLAEKALEIHEIYGTPSQVAEDYGFLAEVALQQSQWEKACESANLALSVLAEAGINKKETGLYLLLLAKGQRNLIPCSTVNPPQPALAKGGSESVFSPLEIIETLTQAKVITQPQDDVQLYLRILEELRTLYFEQGEYLKAFYIKLEQQAVKSKYGLQAFIGAGRLQSPQQTIDIGLESGLSKAEIVEEIEAASGRAQDIKRIIQRIGRDDCKLTIIHGQSGVGKSSIIQAGLVPALQFTTFKARDLLPVLLHSYHDWARNCGQCLRSGIKKIKGESLSTPIDTPTAILEQLRLNQNRNLLTVLIFDQFEEFFFAYPDQTSRRELYNFLAECLNIFNLKIILSLREDYLFYLFEFNRATNLLIINNDILTQNICYYLGNFSLPDAKTVLQTLTKRSQLDLSEDLVNALVEDLAGEVREVRPIELQIVGTQLEKQQITRLSEYQQLGNQAKLKLVEEFLAEVIADCGQENKDIAELVLYLLTDENNTRPQKNLAELAAHLGTESERLELVIEIVVKSGLVLEVPATPIERYQLVHDYLVPFIRKQRGAELLELRQKLKQTETENQILAEARQKAEQLSAAAKRQVKWLTTGATIFSISLIGAVTAMGVAWQQVDKAQKLTKLERAASDALRMFESGNNQIDALISAVKTGKELKSTVKDVRSLADYPISTPQMALNQILDNIREQNRFRGHQAEVLSVSFSPDGKYIATASKDTTARLWDIKGKLIQEFKGHQIWVFSVSFSPDGKYIATASGEKTVRLWDLTGKPIKKFKGYPHGGLNGVTSVSFSPDGKYIATGSADKTARLWDLTGKLIKEFKGHQDLVWSVSFSPDGKYIATGSWDKTTRLWDLTGKLIQEFKGHQDRVWSVSFSPDGKYIATGSRDKTARLWDLTGKLIQEFKGHQNGVSSVSFSPDSKYIATASGEKTVRLWDLTGKLIQEFKGHQDLVWGVSWSPDGKYIATASYNTARLWHLTGKLIQKFKGHKSWVSSVSFSPDGKYIATASYDKTARLWDVKRNLIQEFKGDQDSVSSVSFSPDGKYIATASSDNTARLWDLTGKLIQEFKGHQGWVRSVSFSPDGKYIATGSWDNTARLWDLTGKLIQKFKGHQGWVTSVSFSPDGKYIATASNDNTARLWDVKGKLIQEFKGHQDPVTSVSFSPDGKYIATASLDKTARLWDLKKGKLIQEFKGHQGWVSSVSFSPDGKYIATASRDKTARLWDVTGKLIQEFKGHQDGILSVSFSPDGKYIATASEDKTARLWRIRSLDEMLVQGCDWLHDYLQNNADESEKHLCDGISAQKND